MASLAVDDELHKRLKIRCSELGLKIKNVANEAIEDWLKKYGEKRSRKGAIKFFFGFISKNRIGEWKFKPCARLVVKRKTRIDRNLEINSLLMGKSYSNKVRAELRRIPKRVKKRASEFIGFVKTFAKLPFVLNKVFIILRKV